MDVQTYLVEKEPTVFVNENKMKTGIPHHTTPPATLCTLKSDVCITEGSGVIRKRIHFILSDYIAKVKPLLVYG